jgi:hypothetical protein
MAHLSPQLFGLPDTPSSQGPLDSLWMTPEMGLRMRFDFARSVIDMAEKTEQKRRAAEEAPKQPAQKPPPPEAPALPTLPPPPPIRLLRY